MSHNPYHTEPFTNPPQQPQSNSKLILIIAACVAVVFGLASVGVVVWMASDSDSNNADDPKEDPGKSESADPAEEEEPTEEEATPLLVTYDVPSGFEESTDSYLLHPLYDDREEHHMYMPDAETYESVWVISYAMPNDTSSLSEDDLIAEVNLYGETVEKENTDEPKADTVAGKSAIVDYIEASGGSTDKIRYDAYFFFDGQHLVEVGCQYDKEKDTVKDACTEVLDSLYW
ncbi:MAG: hypothetical protein ACRDXX_19160 [Stackebrandtia sp.]